MRRRVVTQSDQRPPASAASTSRRKGPRPKHVPQRMCVACREQDAKRGLTRIVRTPEGTVGNRSDRQAQRPRRLSLRHRPAAGSGQLPLNVLAKALNAGIDRRKFATRFAQFAPAMRVETTAGDAAQRKGDTHMVKSI